MNHSYWRKMGRIAGCGAAWLWFLSLSLGVARAEAPPAAAPERALSIRQIDEARDEPARRRLEAIRQVLPEKYRRRRNFAWAVAKIDGLDKEEYFAHSGVDRRREIFSASDSVAETISVRPKKRGRFEILCVNHNDEVEGEDCFPRTSDTEYKIIEELGSRLSDPSSRGRVRIYTDLYPCASCRHVMRQFLDIYTNVQMQILYRDR